MTKQEHLLPFAHCLCAFFCASRHRTHAPGAPPSNQPSQTPPKGGMVGPGGPLVAALSIPQQRSIPDRFLGDGPRMPPRSAHAHTLTRTTSHHNHSPEPRYDWQSVCTKAWWCALGPATPPCRTGRAILRERRMPLSYKRFVLASPATT